ncbi:MAG: PAS domain-containing protein [Smithella sp.]|jgi:PAS domain S-box-containing protein
MKKELPIEEQHFRVFVENSPDIIVLINLKGIITYINPAVEKVLGFKVEEMIGITGFENLHPDDFKLVNDKYNMFLSDINAPAERADIRFRHKDGSWRTFDVVASNLIHDNVIEAVIINFRDITERKQAEEALRQSEEKHRTILENIEEGYYEVNLAGNFTFFNDSLCIIHGYSKDELMGMNYRQYTDIENAKIIFESFNKLYKTGEPFKGFDWQITRKDGTKRYIEQSASLKKDSTGNPIGFRGITRDITERKQAEEKLRESETSYRQLFDNSPAAIYRVDFKSGRFLKANDVFCKYFGCRQEEITSLSPYDILTEDSKKLFLERMEKMALGVEVPNIVEYEVVDKKGKRWFLQLNNKDIYDTEGHVVAADVVAHDIT